jgi:hypothetical protein
VETITLNKPFVYEDQEFTEIKLDLDSLTGEDMISAARESKALGDTSTVPELSKTYLAVVSAKAAKVPVDMIVALPAKDFSKITMATQNFLFE